MGIIVNEDTAILNVSYSDANERNKKEQEYLDYIKDHIAKVNEMFNLYFIPLLEESAISSLVSDEDLKLGIQELQTIINTHDASKFSDAEFDGYRAKYYPTLLEQNADTDYILAMEDRYEQCWIHHYTVNDHHPMHWVNKETGIPEDMTIRAIIEMLCDWEAMSLNFDTSTVEWYQNKAIDEKKAMSTTTRTIVEDLLFNVLHQ